MRPSRRFHRATALWLAAAPLLLSASALGFDSGGTDQGNISYTLPAYIPIAQDAFIVGNCGLSYHALDFNHVSCNTAWAEENLTFNYTAKVFHSAFANLAGDYTDPQGMVAPILACPRAPGAASPPTDLSQCQPTPWSSVASVSPLGWVKARRAWNIPPAGEWNSFVTPEHMLIAQAAASLAGFDAISLMSRPFWVRYPTHGDYVSSPATPTQYFVSASYIPAPLGEVGAQVSRPYFLPELAQLPDASFSVSDWVSGNETCPVAGVAPTTPGGAGAFGNGTSAYDANTCHEFGKLLGTINTSHFKGNGQVYWNWYHGLALQRMAVCASMAPALTPYWTSDDVTAQNTEVHECEREAMVYEMFAQHFLQDAWSTGHMWMRWGSPELTDYPTDFGNPIDWTIRYPNENVAARQTVAAVIVGAASGMIHGTKAVSQGTFLGSIPLATDDPLCAPTMHMPWVPGSGQPVQWNSGGAVFPGAGDYFYAPSPSFMKPSISVDATFQEQRTRLLGCAARSMRDVYLAGPQLHGALAPSANIGGVSLDSIDPSSDYCWGQWATNDSMLGALAPFYISREWPNLASTLGDIAGGLIANLLVINKEKSGFPNLDPVYLNDLLGLYSTQWVLSTMDLQTAFTLNTITDGDEGTDSAHLTGPFGPLNLLGVTPNHLVNPTVGLPPSTYADRSAAPRADQTSFPQDYYVQRMFRRSHLAETCAESNPDTLVALQAKCLAGATEGGDPEACTACVDATEPHIPLCLSDQMAPSKCGAIFAETGAYPSEWNDPVWRTRTHGLVNGCSSASDEAVMYCTGTQDRDDGNFALAEGRDFIFSQTLSTQQVTSQCSTPATAGTNAEPITLSALVQRQVAIVKHEGDPTLQAPGPVVTALQVTETTNEDLLATNLCKSYITTSIDDIAQSAVTPFPMMSSPVTADQALIGNPWLELDIATCGPQQRYTLWNRSCTDVVSNYALGSTIDLTQTLGLTGGRATLGWGFLDWTFPNNTDGQGPFTTVPEERCAIVEPRKYDRTCRLGSTCGSNNLCVPAISSPLVASYLTYW